ncbi:MAG: hypothetical protein KBT03_10405, partial [Bacteroidales bacterium]|nr:hypothetical protein [Candidatus Scybalousia scybalohippi]
MKLLKACKELIIQEPFYGFFLLSIQKTLTNEIQTLGVKKENLNFNLAVNENFWNSLNDKEQLAVLKHEILHICFFHLTTNFDVGNHELMNVAMDCEVNQYIDNLPSNAITLQFVSNLIGKSLPPKQGAMYYYKQLEEYAQKNPCSFPSFDEHEFSTDANDEKVKIENKLYENQIKSRLENTENYIKKTAGNLPGEMMAILEMIKLKPQIFNWRRFLSRSIGNLISSELKLTKLRPSKRIPDSKGILLKYKHNICVVVDTSGSINMQNFEDFMSEIQHIYNSGNDITIVECDTTITKIFKYTKSSKIEFKGRGGTDLTDAIQYYKDH